MDLILIVCVLYDVRSAVQFIYYDPAVQKVIVKTGVEL